MQDLYYRRLGEAIYFAVRIDPLLGISNSPLSTDWEAWASIIAITFPVDAATPFQQVRRLTAASAWSAGRDGLRQVSFEPAWLAVQPDDRMSPAEAVEALAPHITSGVRTRPVVLLSGGWDSRLLAALARRRWRRIPAWTTSNDDGYDHDVALARNVAGALRLRHRTLIPGPEAWADEHMAVYKRMEFQTTHHIWFMPLARSIHHQARWVLDGLAGDVLFKSLFVSSELADTRDPVQRWRSLWDSLSQRRVHQRHLLARGVAASFEDRSRVEFESVVGRFEGHPAAATLAVLHTRTARGIASSPQWLLGPEVEVRLPFVHPDVITNALRVPIGAKAGGEFYRQMLVAANPDVAALPSTNDRRPRGKRGPVRQTSARALRSLAQPILADEGTLRLLSPELRLALRSPEALAVIARSTRAVRLLQGMSLLGAWRATYAARLGNDLFPDS